MGFHPMPRTPVNRLRLARFRGLGQRPKYKSPLLLCVKNILRPPTFLHFYTAKTYPAVE